MPGPRPPFPFFRFLSTMLQHATSMLHPRNLYYKKSSTTFKKSKKKYSLVQSGRGPPDAHTPLFQSRKKNSFPAVFVVSTPLTYNILLTPPPLSTAPNQLSSSTAVRNGKSLFGRLGLFADGLALPRDGGVGHFQRRRCAGRFVAAVVEVSFACLQKNHGQ